MLWLTCDEAFDIVDQLIRQELHRAVRCQATCGVRIKFGVFMSSKGLPSFGGSLVSTSKPAPDQTSFERCFQCLLVHQTTTRSVDQNRTAFHLLELLKTDEIA